MTSALEVATAAIDKLNMEHGSIYHRIAPGRPEAAAVLDALGIPHFTEWEGWTEALANLGAVDDRVRIEEGVVNLVVRHGEYINRGAVLDIVRGEA